MDYYVRTKHVSRSGKFLIAFPIAIAPSSEIELTLKNGVKMIQINKMTKKIIWIQKQQQEHTSDKAGDT